MERLAGAVMVLAASVCLLAGSLAKESGWASAAGVAAVLCACIGVAYLYLGDRRG